MEQYLDFALVHYYLCLRHFDIRYMFVYVCMHVWNECHNEIIIMLDYTMLFDFETFNFLHKFPQNKFIIFFYFEICVFKLK